MKIKKAIWETTLRNILKSVNTKELFIATNYVSVNFKNDNTKLFNYNFERKRIYINLKVINELINCGFVVITDYAQFKKILLQSLLINDCSVEIGYFTLFFS